MSTPGAKDLLAQADRLMRHRAPEELPVLTDLVVEEIEIGDAVALPPRAPHAEPVPPSAPPPVARAAPAQPSVPTAPPPAPGGIAGTPLTTPTRPSAREMAAFINARAEASPDAPAAPGSGAASLREQLNAMLVPRLEELRHSVYSQVMQQLELHAGGSLKAHLQEALSVALADIARDIAVQVAEDTSTQVRQVVSDAVDAEIARLREQLAAKRR